MTAWTAERLDPAAGAIIRWPDLKGEGGAYNTMGRRVAAAVVEGNLDGGIVRLECSVGTTWFPMTDATGEPWAAKEPRMAPAFPATLLVRPRLTGAGKKAAVSVTLILKE